MGVSEEQCWNLRADPGHRMIYDAGDEVGICRTALPYTGNHSESLLTGMLSRQA